MQAINGIPFSMLLILGVIGVAIFVGFHLYRRLILPILLLKETGPAHQKSVDRLEIICWAIYFIVLIYNALMMSLAVTTILLVVISLAFFDFWKNYFAGIILKFSDKLQLGDVISVNELRGKVIAFGSRDLKIVSTIGEEILIPYQLINTEVKIAQKRTPKILYKTFIFEEAIGANLSAKDKLTKAVYANPWIIISRPVNIALEEDHVTLSFYVLSNEFFERAKQRLVMDFRKSI